MKMGERRPACVQPCTPWGLVHTYFILVSLFVTTISASNPAQSNILPGNNTPSNFSNSSTQSSTPTTATFVMECCLPNIYANDHCWLDDNTLVIGDIYTNKLVKATVNRNTKNCTYSVYSDNPTYPDRVACSPNGDEIYVISRFGSVLVFDRNSLKAIWEPEGMVGSPYNVVMNLNVVIVGTGTKGPLYVYDRNRIYQGQISISQNQFEFEFIHLTEEGVFVATTKDDKLVIHDIPNVSTIIAGGTGSGNGRFDGAYGVTTVGDYILVCDFYNKRVPVFSQYGGFHGNLQFKGAEVFVRVYMAYRSETKLLSLSGGGMSSYIKLFTLT